MDFAPLTRHPDDRIFAWLHARRGEGDVAGYSAADVSAEVALGGRGGRSASGALQRLTRSGHVEAVPRTDGRLRPLLFRALPYPPLSAGAHLRPEQWPTVARLVAAHPAAQAGYPTHVRVRPLSSGRVQVSVWADLHVVSEHRGPRFGLAAEVVHVVERDGAIVGPSARERDSAETTPTSGAAER